MKDLVVCCDGTGHEYQSRGNTNVVRLFEAIRSDSPDSTVRAFYDPGLGTFSAPGAFTNTARWWSKVLGLGLGYGLRENLSDAYRFLMDWHEPGDRIWLFGFSRGAYTVRALAAMLDMIGLLERGRENLLDYAMKIYWQKKEDHELANSFRANFCRGEKIRVHYVGVWDTVKSVGLFRAVRLPLVRKLCVVDHGRHAVAIDEKRSRYRPHLWKRADGADYQQVWFAGVHSDIGGTYDDAPQLADIALNWIATGARQLGLDIDLDRLPPITGQHPVGTLHRSLLPLWWILGWRRRAIPAGAWVHSSVRQRMEKTAYRPRLPADAVFVD